MENTNINEILEKENGYLKVNKPINSLMDYIDLVKQIIVGKNIKKPWFRGQEDCNWDLTPNIYRIKKTHYKLEIENYVFNEFKRRAFTLYSEEMLPSIEKGSDMDWLFLMQHHNIPTRLLDWTRSSLIGLYFAVNSYWKDKNNSAVWIIDPTWINKNTINYDDVLYVKKDTEVHTMQYMGDKPPQLPISFVPNYLEKKIIPHKNCFTLHGLSPNGLHEISSSATASKIIKIEINKASEKNIFDELCLSGITHTNIFPNLDGLANEIVYEFELFNRKEDI